MDLDDPRIDKIVIVVVALFLLYLGWHVARWVF